MHLHHPGNPIPRKGIRETSMNSGYYEEDYHRVVERTEPTRFLPGSNVEIVVEP